MASLGLVGDLVYGNFLQVDKSPYFATVCVSLTLCIIALVSLSSSHSLVERWHGSWRE